MVAMNFFNPFFAAVMNGEHNLSTGSVKIALSNVAPDPTWSSLTSVTQIAAINGYVAGGQALDNVTSTQTAGVYALKADDEVFTAAGGSMATFRYAVLYNDSHASDGLIGWWDYGSAIDLSVGETCTIDFIARVVFTFTIDT